MIPRFRAWDKNGQKMFSEDELIIWNNNVYANDSEKLSCDYLKGWSIDGQYLMQSTGLTDNNGKEIFEGDIVKVTDGDERTNFPDGGIGTICGLDEIFMWYIDGQVHNGLFDISQEYYIEVVGNIYENQELIEVSS